MAGEPTIAPAGQAYWKPISRQQSIRVV
jgi:hypothetical protein